MMPVESSSGTVKMPSRSIERPAAPQKPNVHRQPRVSGRNASRVSPRVPREESSTTAATPARAAARRPRGGAGALLLAPAPPRGPGGEGSAGGDAGELPRQLLGRQAAA